MIGFQSEVLVFERLDVSVLDSLFEFGLSIDLELLDYSDVSDAESVGPEMFGRLLLLVGYEYLVYPLLGHLELNSDLFVGETLFAEFCDLVDCFCEFHSW